MGERSIAVIQGVPKPSGFVFTRRSDTPSQPLSLLDAIDKVA
jgi:hypothetical protein